MAEANIDRPVYLIAPLGRSPAVVTETLWYLTVVERRRVYGVELWVTHSDVGAACGLDVLRSAMRGDVSLWDRLRASVGEHDGLLPELRLDFRVERPGVNTPVRPGLTVIGFEHDGRPLPDIRTPTEAEAIAEQLHARVRTLCRVLEQEQVDLIGSIAGGRKNMSSALQGAFELQARPTDVLLHVLLHPKIEEDPSLARSYVAPVDGLGGLGSADQVSVFEVPFAPLRTLLTEDRWQVALDRGSSVALWRDIRVNRTRAASHTARFAREGSQWFLIVERDRHPVEQVPLATNEVEMYAALVARPAPTLVTGTQLEEWGDYIAAHRLGPAPDEVVSIGAVRSRLGTLQRKLQALRTHGLEDFGVSGRGAKATITAAARVTLPTVP